MKMATLAVTFFREDGIRKPQVAKATEAGSRKIAAAIYT